MQAASNFRQSGPVQKDLYFTSDHEWIDFQGSVAYVGICSFKLKGIRQIEKIEHARNGDLLKAGEVMASILYDDYRIDVHMPVGGRIAAINESVLAGKTHLVLQQPETAGWIARIIPASPYDRKGLLISEQYRMRTKSIY